MATWKEISADAFKAAQKLLREHPRSAISRLYYAAYSAITSELADNVTFARGWKNPSHEVVVKLIDGNLPAISRELRRNLKKRIRRLYDARIDADYAPHRTVDEQTAQGCLHDARFVLSNLKVL